MLILTLTLIAALLFLGLSPEVKMGCVTILFWVAALPAALLLIAFTF